MNNQAGIGMSAFHRFKNLVEWNDHEFEFAEEKLKCEKCAGHLAGDSNRSAAQKIAPIQLLDWALKLVR